jgi:LysM repeat protein
MGRPAKALSGFNRTVGSNPTLSAKLLRAVCLTLLIVGSVVLVDSAPVSACANEYVAKRGDSWWSIAEKHGLTLNKVLVLNNANAAKKILIGDAVCVARASKKSAPPPARIKYKPSEVAQIIREEWPDDLEERAIQIARRESKLNPAVIGIPNNCCFGLFQIYHRWHKTWLPDVGVNRPEQLLDPRLNARAAYRLFQRNNGWGPWE